MLKQWFYNALTVIAAIVVGWLLVATFVLSANGRGWWLAIWFVALILLVSLVFTLWDRYS